MNNLCSLKGLIDKFNNEKIEGLTDFEQIRVFNALKDLKMYQEIGTIAEFMGLKNMRIGDKTDTKAKGICGEVERGK